MGLECQQSRAMTRHETRDETAEESAQSCWTKKAGRAGQTGKTDWRTTGKAVTLGKSRKQTRIDEPRAGLALDETRFGNGMV